jgi:beta-N-acetylhexosaminidase
VEHTLASLSLREKAGQMMMAWTGGEYVASDSPKMARLLELVRADGVGGIIISIGSPYSYAAKLNALQRNARVPLLVATDMESGPGMRLNAGYTIPGMLPQGGGTDFPPVMALAATGSDSLAFEVGRVIAVEGRAAGVTLNLAPVLDVNSNPANPIINTRSFGEDPAAVARFGAAYVRGLHAGGMLAAGKHFPGHGDAATDSHIGLPLIRASRARLDSVELVPFRAGVAAGLDAVLVGHIAVPAIDPEDGRPASLSPRIVTGILRGEMGFRGIVFTDAMNMGGLTRRFSQADAAVLAIEAGADILLQPDDPRAAVTAVEAAVRSGRISESRIDASVRRILAAKERAGLAQRREVDPRAIPGVVGIDANERLAAEVAARSITLARDDRGLVPISRTARRVLSITYAVAGSLTAGRAFDEALSGPERAVESVRVDGRTSAAEYADLARRAASAEVVIVSAYVAPRQYRGSVDAAEGFSGFVERLAASGAPVIAVSFGSPYLVSAFPSVPAYLLAWGREEVCQRAAADALLGRAPITGRLPVSLPPLFPIGAGLRRDEVQ